MPVWGDPDLDRYMMAEIKNLYDQGELIYFVDRGLAINVAAGGMPKNSAAAFVSVLSPVSFLAALPLGIFYSWWAAVGAVFLGVYLFKTSKNLIERRLRKWAFEDERIFEMLRDKHVIWFKRRE